MTKKQSLGPLMVSVEGYTLTNKRASHAKTPLDWGRYFVHA